MLYDQFKQIETMSADFEGYVIYALSLHAEQTEEAYEWHNKGFKNAFDVQLQVSVTVILLSVATLNLLTLFEASLAAEDQDDYLRLSTLYLEEERYEDLVASFSRL